MKAPVTLKEVAAAAGVSKSTVANVFNSPERVRPELRTRIETVARALGYAGPDPKGRLLSSGKANAIGFVPPADAGFAWVHTAPYMQELLTGISEVCEEQQVGLLLIVTKDKHGRSGIPRAVVDGMILGNASQADLIEPGLRRKIRFVVMDGDGGEDMSSIRFNHREGACRLIRYLVGLGHRRFAFITVSRIAGSPLFHVAGKGNPGLVAGYAEDWESYEGAAQALAEAGLSIDSMPLLEACGSDDELRDFGDPHDLLLDNAPGATAVVSFHGGMTASLFAAVQRRGIAAPEAISVAGLSDVRCADGTNAPLTVLVRSLAATEIGRVTAQMLFDPGPARHLLFPLELVIGRSTGPPPT